MTAQALLDRLTAQDMRLVMRDGALAIDAPRGAIHPALLAELRARKAELIALLGRPARAQAEPPPSKRFSLSAPRPAHSPLSDATWRPNHPHSRYVEPYKAALLAKLKLDRRYVRAEGVWMFDEDGRAVLDALSQYGALPLGHNPPEIWAALRETEASGAPAFAANSVQDAAGALAERLVGLWPEAGFTNVTFTNSGAESLEVAIKLCRAATGRHDMLSLSGAFHGLTVGALSLAGSPLYRRSFASEDGAVQLPAGDPAALERLLAAKPERFAGLVIEPIQGESGIIDLPDGYLAAVRTICDRHGTLLVLDEVQTGLGRTGDLFAAQCDGVVPDVMTLAKALGGGLLPIGACLYRPSARSERFGLRHSSTFAGGTLACRAGLALIDRITADNNAIVRAVAENGRYLRAGLEGLQARFPHLVTRVSGRGYMQGLRLDFSACSAIDGLIGLFHDQNVLIHLTVSHLLHAGGVRLAPSFSSGDVLRIQPPLIAERAHLDRIVAAIGETMALVAAGDTLALAGHLLDLLPSNGATAPASPVPAAARPPAEAVVTPPEVGRFGFVVHPLEAADLRRLDPAFADLDAEALRTALGRFTDFIDPQPIETLEVIGRDGARAYGELILLPYTPADLVAMPHAKAAAEVELAVRVAQRRGARIVGLGGFSSIVAEGGLALTGEDLPALTSGNAFTAAATRQVLVAASERAGLDPTASTAAVLGAGGMVARALAELLAGEFASLVLVGNSARPRYAARSRAVARDLIRSLIAARRLLRPRTGSLAERLAQPDIPGDADAALNLLAREGRLRFGGTMADSLPSADAVGIAVSSLAQIVAPEHLKHGAVVCDASRPLAVDDAVVQTRPDVTLLEAGVVRPPDGSINGAFAGPEPGALFACAAETILWSLERAYDSVRPDACMEIGAILHLEQLAHMHGFHVVGS